MISSRELAAASGLPMPTIHRLMRTLVARGYARQAPSRRYTLGPNLIRLGEGAGRQLGAEGLDQFRHTKLVMVDPAADTQDFWWFPYADEESYPGNDA